VIAIVDYQMGNLRSVQKAFEHKGFEARITDNRSVIAKARGLVLPGVGAFGDCYHELRTRGLIQAILEYLESGRPFLGICLGLQILFTSSEESEGAPGLNVIPGRVRRFSNGLLKVPHMGWNQVKAGTRAAGGNSARKCPLFDGIAEDAYFYFVHSYYVEPEDKSVIAGLTDYGISFVSALWRNNIFATQFHPEKSQDAGLKLIENFGRLVAGESGLARIEGQGI
jgi:glutamine amidotransferase